MYISLKLIIIIIIAWFSHAGSHIQQHMREILLLLDYNVQTSREYNVHDVINISYNISKCLKESKLSDWIILYNVAGNSIV